MNSVKIGIVGAGGIAGKFIEACQIVDIAEVVAIASRSKERADVFAEQYKIKKAYGNYDEMMADVEVQAIYVAVVNSEHLKIIEMAAKAGKAILCEKPAIIGKEEAVRVQKVLEENNVLFMEALWTLHLPAIKKAKEWITEGKIGQLKTIYASFSFWADKEKGGKAFCKETRGGGLLGVGVYNIAFAMFMAGNFPIDVKSMDVMGSTGIDEVGVCLLRFPKDIIATTHFGVALHRKNFSYLHGTEGYVEVERFWDCNKISLYNRKKELLETFVAREENGFIYEVEHFCELYLSGKKESPVNTLDISYGYVDIYEKVRAQR